MEITTKILKNGLLNTTSVTLMINYRWLIFADTVQVILSLV